ncbi:MAG: hypothetical protein M1831_006280 [Alyxoria varia]|nr:MAG: hypothetical protein M1831_006280 [Alyxoria varia]
MCFEIKGKCIGDDHDTFKDREFHASVFCTTSKVNGHEAQCSDQPIDETEHWGKCRNCLTSGKDEVSAPASEDVVRKEVLSWSSITTEGKLTALQHYWKNLDETSDPEQQKRRVFIMDTWFKYREGLKRGPKGESLA